MSKFNVLKKRILVSNIPCVASPSPSVTVPSLYLISKPLVSLRAQSVKNPPAMQEPPVRLLGWEDLLEKG